MSVGRSAMVPWQSTQVMRGGVARFAVELAVAVDVEKEMAVDALHAAGEMNVVQVNCLGEFLRIAMRDRAIVEVEQGALAIVFEDGSEDPAVAVVVGELGVSLVADSARRSGRQNRDRPRARERRRPRD